MRQNKKKWRQMNWREAEMKALKDWRDASILDPRGLLLIRCMVFLSAWSMFLSAFLYSERTGSVVELLVGMMAFIVLFIMWDALLISIRRFIYFFGDRVFVLVVVGVYVAAFTASGVHFASGKLIAIVLYGIVCGAFLGVVFLSGILDFAGAAALNVAVFTILVVAGSAANLAIPLSTVTALMGAVLTTDAVKRAVGAQSRADDLNDRKTRKPHWYRELDNVRESRIADCSELINGDSDATIGLAGRRGLGKTNLLYLMSEKFEGETAQVIRDENDLEIVEMVNNCRIRRWSLFIRCPANFGEMSFILAVLEQMALKVNLLLTRLLPAVKAYDVERELEEKRRVLRFPHYLHLAVAIVLMITVGWRYWQSDISDPILKPVVGHRTTVDSTRHSSLYMALSDSLSQVIEPQIQSIEDSLQKIGFLLNRASPISGIMDAKARYSSLQKSSSWPRAELFDSLRAMADSLKRPRDIVKAWERRYATLKDSARSVRREFSRESANSQKWVLFYCTLIGFPVAFVWVWFRTREGNVRLRRREYDAVRNEIALHERTIGLLERLRYHMTIVEGDEIEVTAAGPFQRIKWLGILGRRFRHFGRELRPFNVISLVEEYRNYMSDVVYYLSKALGEGGVQNNDGLKIVVCIDELDKILDTMQLYELLKSVKAIFELNHVYYLLSISEDALETYRLRHAKTKNEIDSAFRHIFNVPPMGAKASLCYFIEPDKKWSTELLPAAIVFGGGVPRDMRRLAELFKVHREWNSLTDCLRYLQRESHDAAVDVIENNPYLSVEWRRRWIADIELAVVCTEDVANDALEKIKELEYGRFVRENPCIGEAAKKTFHQMRALLMAITIMKYVYHRIESIEELQTPLELSQRPEDVEGYLQNLPTKVDGWLGRLQPLTSAIFGLAANPLGVWEKLHLPIQEENGKD